MLENPKTGYSLDIAVCRLFAKCDHLDFAACLLISNMRGCQSKGCKLKQTNAV